MKQFQLQFDNDSFSKIFPYFIFIDENLEIKSFGKSISKIIPEINENDYFLNHFSISRPYLTNLDRTNFNSVTNQLIIISSTTNSISLRGQFEQYGNSYLFIGSTWFNCMEELIENNLTYNDFAYHDPQLDFLHILKNQDITNSELKELLDVVNNQRKELKKEKKEKIKLSLVAKANNNGVVFTNPDGTIFWCNDAYLELTGFTSDEIIGNTPFEIGRDKFSDQAAIKKMISAFYKGESFDLEIIHARKAKPSFWSRTKGQAILDPDGNVIQYFAIIEDITKVKEFSNQLIESENRLTSLIVNLETGILLVNQNKKIVMVNTKFCDMFGITVQPQSLKGKGLNETIETLKKSFKNPDEFTNRMDEILLSQKVEIAEEINLNDGKVFERSFIPISNGQKFFGHLWSFEDITLKKRYQENLESEKEKYRSIIANMNMGLLEVDNDDVIQLANLSFCKMSGYSLIDLLGNKASELLLTSKQQKNINIKIANRNNHISDSYEVKTKNKEGQKRNWFVSGAPNYNENGEVIGSIGIHLDITDQKKLEKQKEQLLSKLEKQNEQLNEYAQIVSHDLKSPLRSIHSLITWIKEDNHQEFSEGTFQYLNLIEGKIEKMDHLIQGVLTYSKVDSDEATNGLIDLNEVINNCIKIIHIPENIKFVIDNKLPVVKADRFRMQQLFQNLLSNAVNYIDKPEGLVSVGYTEEKKNHLFYVKDNGIGIAKENRENIFKIFKTFTQHESSTGIGLSIVKRIVDNYKGSIQIESELTKGTTFFIKLPKTES